MNTRIGIVFLIFMTSLVWADDIDAEILKDLEFYSEMEIVETDAMLETVKKNGTHATAPAHTPAPAGGTQ